MNPIVIALIAFVSISGASFLGLRLRALLHGHHLSVDTKDTVRLGMGLVATMTALLIGLLIASAKDSYDNQRSEVIQMAAKVAFLDRVFAIYGPESAGSRALLRHGVEGTIQRLWPDKNAQAGPEFQDQVIYESIHNLTPHTEMQRALKAQALETAVELSKARALLSAEAAQSIVKPVLVVVIVWLAILFLSFGLFAPSNRIVFATMVVAALSVSSAILLILELDQPFKGVIQISSEPMRNALSRLGQ